MVSLIGRGTALTLVWNGAPALFRGVPTSADISTQALSRNLQAVFGVSNGSEIVDYGRITATNPDPLIFFDWDNKGSSGPQDGESDHVGIVEKVENGIVYTVEGNSGDSCRENHYAVGYYEILGYGVPQY